MNNCFYVYICLDPRKSGEWIFRDKEFNFEPFYVGKGKERRISHHLKPSSLKRQSLKNSKIKAINNANLKPIFEKIFTNLALSEAYALEVEMIKHFGRIDKNTGILANHTDGGEGCVNQIISEKRKREVSIFMKGRFAGSLNPMYGRCGKLHPLYGKHHTPESNEKNKQSNIGKQSGNKHPLYDKTIYTFYNIKTSEEFQGTRYELYTKYNLPDENLYLLIKNKKHSFHGWVLDKEKYFNRPKRKFITKPVYQFNKRTNQLVNIYPSVRDAGINNNYKPSSIYTICNGGRPSVYGYKWKYFENLLDQEKEQVNNFKNTQPSIS